MVNYQTAVLDRTFAALADPTRRALLARLDEEEGLTVSELARPFPVSLPAIMKRLDVLSETEQRVWTPGVDVQAVWVPAANHLLTTGATFYRDNSSDRRTTSTTRPRSPSERFEPDGRQSPRSNRLSATPPPTRSNPANTGCRCIGFQTGRASMFCSASASRTASRSAPNFAGSMVMAVSHRVCRPQGASGMNSTPGRPPRCFT